MNKLNALRQVVIHDPMEVIWPAAISAASFVVGWLLQSLVLRALSAWTSRKTSRPGRILAESVRGPMWIWRSRTPAGRCICAMGESRQYLKSQARGAS